MEGSEKMNKIAYIRSGGQTGVDRAALDVARSKGMPIAGWCPKGGRAEDLTKPPGLLDLYPELKQTPLEKVEQRTVWNVRDSDATLIINPCGFEISEGTDLTEKSALTLNKPCLKVKSDREISTIVSWLNSLGSELTLNIAGPRESECGPAYSETGKIIKKVIEIVTGC